MKSTAKFATATAIVISLGGAALAAGGHGRDGPASPTEQGPGAGHHGMMQMMRGMHAQMMGGHGPMGGMGQSMGRMGGNASLMGMAMQRLDTDGDGTVTPQESREGLQALLAEYDADGNEALSLAEFETLHNALIRETMVDRFQFLDDDGDGAVSVAEIVKPADIMARMQSMRENMMSGRTEGMPQGGKGMPGTPGQGRMGNN